MSENSSPIRRARVGQENSPRKNKPYTKFLPSTTATSTTKSNVSTASSTSTNNTNNTQIKRSPLKDVQGSSAAPLQSLQPLKDKDNKEKDKSKPVRSPLRDIQGPSAAPLQHLIQPLKDKSATLLAIFGKTKAPTASAKPKPQATVSNAPVLTSVSVTSGVLGQLQPRGLNSSFSEKFESRLGIYSGSGSKTDKENEGGLGSALQPHHKSQSRGILVERFTPLFDFPEYSTEILKYWGHMERKFKVKWDYMERQSGISHKMRTILIDWLVEVVNEYDLTEEALHLAVNYMDRFLCVMNVRRTKLQLVGAAALFISSKFEETNPPEVGDFVFVTDETYTKMEILQMERMMLQVLDFDLMIPTSHSYALAYCSILRLLDPIKSLAMYLVDLALMDGDTFLKYLPSVIAGAAVSIGRFVFNSVYWDAKIQGICAHRKKTVSPCVRDLLKVFFEASSQPQTSIHEKYQSVRYCSVSNMFLPNNGPWDE